jgi:hypothetical protein
MSHDPKKIGPGCWSVWQQASIDPDSTLFFLLCKQYRDKFPCIVCREHIKKYMEIDSPFELRKQLDDSGRDISRARWVFIFHNTVNYRLDKPTYSWENFISNYLSESVCTAECGSESKREPEERKYSSS